ncbi:MAG TPA: Holliday junction resolvase RuvX [Candidatus Polarisedimenticolia bacterium]|nr:Holliday junction resolvase RuvX [Candidatus Polarisedimenticolia bacterium]
MSRIMALDVGETTIGVAFSDPMGIIAQPARTIRRQGLRRDLAELLRLIEEQQVSRVIVGLPLRLEGDAGPAAQETERLARRLRDGLGVPVETWDERLSTAQAERALLEGDVSRRRRKDAVHGMAASLILQAWLERNRGERP